jgi:hypothetical protein
MILVLLIARTKEIAIALIANISTQMAMFLRRPTVVLV